MCDLCGLEKQALKAWLKNDLKNVVQLKLIWLVLLSLLNADTFWLRATSPNFQSNHMVNNA